jgi:hypothetical protein
LLLQVAQVAVAVVTHLAVVEAVLVVIELRQVLLL